MLFEKINMPHNSAMTFHSQCFSKCASSISYSDALNYVEVHWSTAVTLS